MRSFFCCILVVFGLAGCATHTPLDYETGTYISQEQISSFKPGDATQTQVVTAIGQPSRKESVGSKELWYYDYTRIGAFFNGNDNESTVFEWSSTSELLQAYKTGRTGKTGNPMIDAAGI